MIICKTSCSLVRKLLKNNLEIRRFAATVGGSCKPLFQECGLCSRRVFMDPKCKVALIVGGTSGIGFATAQELLCNDFYRVIVTDLDTCKGKEAVEKLNNQYGPHKSCFMQLDTYHGENYYKVMKKIIDIFGNLDVLVNTPGIPKKKTWEEEINAKIMAAIRGTMIGTYVMSSQTFRKGGLIVNLASILAFDDFPRAPIYIAANNGIIGFSKSWGASPNYLASNVRTVTLCTGKSEGVVIENPLLPGDAELSATVGQLVTQRASSVGRSVVYLIQYAPSGTIWFTEGDILYKANVPHRHDYSNKTRYF